MTGRSDRVLETLSLYTKWQRNQSWDLVATFGVIFIDRHYILLIHILIMSFWMLATFVLAVFYFNQMQCKTNNRIPFNANKICRHFIDNLILIRNKIKIIFKKLTQKLKMTPKLQLNFSYERNR